MLQKIMMAAALAVGGASSAAAITITPVAASCDAGLPAPAAGLTLGAVVCSADPARIDTGAVNHGAADGAFYSLGLSGVAVFQITPTFGRESFVVEVTNTGTTQQEAAEILVSTDGATFTSVATASNDPGDTGAPAGAQTSFFINGGPFSFIAFRDVSQAVFPGTTSVDGFDLDSFEVTPVPLPPAVAMLLAGVAGLGLIGRRKAAA